MSSVNMIPGHRFIANRMCCRTGFPSLPPTSKMTVHLAVPEKSGQVRAREGHTNKQKQQSSQQRNAFPFVPFQSRSLLFQPLPLFTFLLSLATLPTRPLARLISPRAHSLPLNSSNNNADTLCTAHHSNHSFLVFSTNGQHPASTATTASAR